MCGGKATPRRWKRKWSSVTCAVPPTRERHMPGCCIAWHGNQPSRQNGPKYGDRGRQLPHIGQQRMTTWPISPDSAVPTPWSKPSLRIPCSPFGMGWPGNGSTVSNSGMMCAIIYPHHMNPQHHLHGTLPAHQYGKSIPSPRLAVLRTNSSDKHTIEPPERMW